MLNSQRWQVNTALIMALTLASGAFAPIIIATPVSANFLTEMLSQRTGYTLRQGTIIQVKYDRGDRIIVAPFETNSLNLRVAENITNPQGRVIIPAGSTIEGKLKPTSGGSRFIAERLILASGQTLSLNATSNVLPANQEISNNFNVGSILKGAVLGAAAAAIIAAITGDKTITTGEVLTGAAIGGVLGEILDLYQPGDRAYLVNINPEEDLDLKLGSNLVIPL